MVSDKKFIAENVSGIIKTILVDEYQDTNELQYKILSSVVMADKKIQVTFVGDTDQAIYGGLGGVAKTCDELQKEFGIKFQERELDGCYRSTQRIVDYYSNFQLKSMMIQAVSDIKDETLPDVKFDAPDITPIKYDPMNVFYLISKLLFTESG